MAEIIAVCLSTVTGTSKIPVVHGVMKAGYGLEGDAHAGGDPIRQISLLAFESIEKMNDGNFSFHPGDFAENITTIGINLAALPIKTRLIIGDEATIEITQIGKKCHTGCAIYKQTGRCIMPREGVFASVIKGGTVRSGDTISVI